MFIGVYLWFHSLPVFCAVKMGVQWAGSAPNEDLDHVNQLATINGLPAAKHRETIRCMELAGAIVS